MVPSLNCRMVLILIAVASLPILTDAVLCYQCNSKGPVALRCDNFDASSRFHVNCDKSDMCLTKVYEFQLQNSTIVRTFERGCVPQEKIYLKYEMDRWQKFTERIKYPPGCERLETEDDFPIEYCRCKGDLCNKTYYAKN